MKWWTGTAQDKQEYSGGLSINPVCLWETELALWKVGDDRTEGTWTEDGGKESGDGRMLFVVSVNLQKLSKKIKWDYLTDTNLPYRDEWDIFPM